MNVSIIGDMKETFANDEEMRGGDEDVTTEIFSYENFHRLQSEVRDLRAFQAEMIKRMSRLESQ